MSASDPATRRSSSRIANRDNSTNKSSTTTVKATPKPKTTTTTTTSGEKKRGPVTAPTKSDIEPISKKSKISNDNEVKTTNDKKESGGILKVGDKLPNIKLQNETGKEVEIDNLKNTVIFTYPKANTGGCTAQACLFRDEFDEWKKLGFTIFGLSNDGLTSLKNWKEKKNFQYNLLSDPKRILIGKLTGSQTQTRRSHFVIDGQGKLALSSISVKPADSSPAALKFAKTL